MKIALAMICGCAEGEEKHLENALFSVHKYVHGIYLTFTGSKTEACELVAKKYGAKVNYTDATHTITRKEVAWVKKFLGWKLEMKKGDKIFRFDKARNYNFSSVPKEYDWILWMDTDDVLRKGNKLGQIIQDATQSGTNAIFLNYIYDAVIEKGKIKTVVIEHLRERIVKNEKGLFKWVAPIHETLIGQRDVKYKDYPDVDVLHLSSQKRMNDAMSRNIKNLEYTIYTSKGKDPRHNYYLAKIYFDKGEIGKAWKLIYNHYLTGKHKSGWPEERAQGWRYLGEISLRQNKFNMMVKANMNALVEEPDNPASYVNLGIAYLLKKDYKKALYWIKLASAVPEKRSTLVHSPRDLIMRTLQVLYEANLRLNNIDEAWAAATKMQEVSPEDSNARKAKMFMDSLREEKELTKALVKTARHLLHSGQADKIKPLLTSVPKMIQGNPFVADLYKKHYPPNNWGKKSVVIYCGPGFTNWSPKKLDNPEGSFLGGSEESVIRISRELNKLGWEVVVYADPGIDEGMNDGVLWLPYFKFNLKDKFNILVVWRMVNFFDQKVAAKKKYLWLHDIQKDTEYTKERVERIDKVFFLSKWHRETVPSLPKEKVFLTSNGI